MGHAILPDKNDKNTNFKRDILRMCIDNGSCSIADISRDINTSVPTVTKLVGELIDDGLLREIGKQDTSGGRRPSIFGLNPDAGFFIGVDIARQHFHIAISDFKGDIVKFIQDIEFVLEPNPESGQKLSTIIRARVIQEGIPWDNVLGVGISLSGRVNPEKGYSLTYFVSEDLPLKDFFERDLGVPVGIENDSRAMTYGEFMTCKSTEKDMIFINISWGLGMGMILDGKLYYGKSGFSGEIGHFSGLANNHICRCGKVGCLETGASGFALHRMITDWLAEGKTSSLSAKYNQFGEISLEDILDAVKEEDVLAIEGIEEVGETLGRGISGVINIFNPGTVVVGGRLMVGGDYLMLPLKTGINKYSLNRVSSDTTICFSQLKRKAAAVGDCLLMRAKLLGLM